MAARRSAPLRASPLRACGSRAPRLGADASAWGTRLWQDGDAEIEGLKAHYEARLAGEREAGLRLKGENGLMKKKCAPLRIMIGRLTN